MDRAVTGSDEPALLERLRLGEDAAFGELFEQHAAAVRRLARGLASDSSEAEDITAETFFRVLQAVRRGNGPRDNVRAYLLTVARRVCWEWHGARRDVPVTDDELTHRAGAGSDAQNRTAETTLITRAFTSLPERWRTVLWQTEVEGLQPAHAARDFGLSANATAALARRARLGLRAAYLQAHLAVDRSSDGCRTVMEKLGGYTAGSVTGAEARKIKSHLGTCTSCRSTHDELLDVCSSLRAHAGVIVLFVPAAGLAAGVGTVGTVGGAGGTAGSVAAAAGAGGSAGSAAAVGGVGGTAVAIGKVGFALASTAFVGVVGIIGPSDPQTRDAIGLPSNGDNAELQLAEPTGPGRDSPSLIPGKTIADEGYLEHQRSATPREDVPTGGEQPATEYSVPRGLEIASEATAGKTPADGTELPGHSESAGGNGKAIGKTNGNGNNGNGNARSDLGATEVNATTVKSKENSKDKASKTTTSHPTGKPSSPPGKPASKLVRSTGPPAEPGKSATPASAGRASPESGDAAACGHGPPPPWASPQAGHGDDCASNGAAAFPSD